jgi:hypothetical protein
MSAVCPPTETQQRVPRVIRTWWDRTAHGSANGQLQEGSPRYFRSSQFRTCPSSAGQ